ncbi:type II toxin-antitoxin system RelB/DinJ family antitoxin [Membranicola marinus]|uniref:Type II toxin-antitoxin system RelB/DinJ family antitoxin n=1 Tax=Membranihabitans marinus TaxID=1227546 RepID=A0A953LAF8_9BACT|nr:type II toxin-antitoxin system RelB/DinJ family antitoxin [Membranihabitans marinus]MBY5958663.1 type II toxin-antitoxin system RelB/DinJ family antitoxin [Membranihabitans marinus]
MAGKIITTRVDPEVLGDAEEILTTLGISRSVAINMFYRMVIFKKGLPWDPKLDETEYIQMNENLVEQIEKGLKDFEEGKFFPAPSSMTDEINSLS